LLSYALLNKWKIGRCREDLIMFYSMDDNIVSELLHDNICMCNCVCNMYVLAFYIALQCVLTLNSAEQAVHSAGEWSVL